MGELEKARSANLFTTPMLAHVWADAAELNGPLRDVILAREQTHPSTELSNVGGWHSQAGRLEFCGPAGARLVQHMQEMTEEATRRLYAQYARPADPVSWTLSAWANVNRPGDYNKMHTHPGATWSGVYYVDTGSEGESAASLCQTQPPRAPTASFRNC